VLGSFRGVLIRVHENREYRDYRDQSRGQRYRGPQLDVSLVLRSLPTLLFSLSSCFFLNVERSRATADTDREEEGLTQIP
jgi:hypothetical protein